MMHALQRSTPRGDVPVPNFTQSHSTPAALARTTMRLFLGAALTIAVSALEPACANPITGLVNTGAGLSDGQIDPNYTVVQIPAVDGPSAGAAAVVGGGFPFGYWISPPAGANWISAYGRDPNLDPTANGDYAYQLSFYLPANATSLIITGEWAADNFGDDILFNGLSSGDTTAIGPYGSSFAGLTPFTITGTGHAGRNTLDFEVVNYAQNGGNPTGLLVTDIAGVYTPGSDPVGVYTPGSDPVPEPVSLATFGVGLAGLALIRRRKVA